MISLTNKDFERILRKFADDPDDVLVDKQTIICKINGEDICVEWSEEDDVLYCKEPNGNLIKARVWIEKRLAKLDELASKISQYVTYDEHFIPVPSFFETPETRKDVSQTTDAIYDIVTGKNAYATEAVYLLSEAGDGKTMIMDRLANKVAQKYKAGELHCLFLPVSLQGRPFLRIDDLVIGILANKYRFRRFYFEAIIELVKLNMIVLGLDGFEEMVVEGKEDNVISSLGELLSQMDSNGKLVISARRAFYDYALKSQAPLIESIRDLKVDFSSFRLSAWSQKEFSNLLGSYNFDSKSQKEIYEALTTRLGCDHPILTRPVLARKLVEMLAENHGNWASITNSFDESRNPQSVIKQFVAMLLKREATEKWVSLSGAINRQLLKTDQHFELLKILAEEMWLSNVEFVKLDYLQAWMEIFCEQQKLSPAETKDCKEKIIHHAMLLKDGDSFFFCHEAFRQFFLGQQIASYMLHNNFAFQLNKILAQDILPLPTIDSIAFELGNSSIAFESLAIKLCGLKGGVSKISPISQNIGGILLALWKKGKHTQKYEFKDLFFAESALASCTLQNLIFKDCIIEKIDASSKDSIMNVEFLNCSITTLEIERYNECTMSNCLFDTVSLPDHLHIKEYDDDQYAPEQIKRIIVSCGGKLPDSNVSSDIQIQQTEESLAVLDKIVRKFYRTSGVSGNVLSLMFGEKWSSYRKDYMPLYLDNELLETTHWEGKGSDERYKLGISMAKYEYARKNCNGVFSKFVELCH